MLDFNPTTGKLDFKPSGFTGDLYDSTGNIIATVVSGQIKTVLYGGTGNFLITDIGDILITDTGDNLIYA